MKIELRRFFRGLVILWVLLSSYWAAAHVGPHPSVHDTVAGVIDRMRRELSRDELMKMSIEKAEQFLTAHEREILGTEHISFRVNVPVTVTVLRDSKMKEVPFWLADRGFKRTELRLKEGKLETEGWQKDFAAGRVGLGVHSLNGGGNHYLIAVKAKSASDKLDVTELYPGRLRLAPINFGSPTLHRPR